MTDSKDQPDPKGKQPPAGLERRQDDLSERLENLNTRLGNDKKQRQTRARDEEAERKNRSGIAQAFKLSSEFIAGVLVGGGLGYGIDWFFGTSPWGLIIFLMLGFAAAVLNVLRAAGKVAESDMRLRPAQKMADENRDKGASTPSGKNR